MADNNQDPVALPPLPPSDPEMVKRFGPPTYTAEQMKEYALSAIALLSAMVQPDSKPVYQWKWSHCQSDFDWHTCNKEYYEMMGRYEQATRRILYAQGDTAQPAPIQVDK